MHSIRHFNCELVLSSCRVHRQLRRAVDARVVAERGQRDDGPLLGERGQLLVVPAHQVDEELAGLGDAAADDE